jgi:hypothetical protein
MKIELDDGEVTTVLVALDNYRHERETDFLHAGEPQDQEDAGSAEWCWQKISTVQQEYYNSIADAIGEGKTNNPITASVDPFGLPTWSDT